MAPPRPVARRDAGNPTLVYGDAVVGIGFFGRLRAVVGYLLLVSIIGALAAGVIVAAVVALAAGVQGISI